jgi:hypothetical protein
VIAGSFDETQPATSGAAARIVKGLVTRGRQHLDDPATQAVMVAVGERVKEQGAKLVGDGVWRGRHNVTLNLHQVQPGLGRLVHVDREAPQ